MPEASIAYTLRAPACTHMLLGQLRTEGATKTPMATEQLFVAAEK